MRSKASWFVIAVLGTGVALQPGGCAGPQEDPGGTTPLADSDVVADVLVHAREGVVEGELAAMEERLGALATAVDALAASPQEADSVAAAREAFGEALVQWGGLDALQVGPSAPSLDSPAGEDLRDEIYSWPTVNPCRVDQETVSGDYQRDGFFEAELVNVYGLDALEHLLYAPASNACPSQIDINEEGTWDVLGPDGVAQARADYAVAVVAQLQGDVAQLQEAWSGAFGDDFVEGQGPYGDRLEAIDDLFQAVFYVELMKDEKLAYPLGLRECGTTTCPELAESQSADLSGELLRANMATLVALLAPEDGAGFADLLADAGEEDLAEQLRTLVADAEASLVPLGTVRADVDSDPETVQAAYDAVVALADFLEADVATVLALTVPAEAAGDAD